MIMSILASSIFWEEWLLSRKVLWVIIVRAIDRSSFTVVIAHIVIILTCSRGLSVDDRYWNNRSSSYSKLILFQLL